MAIHTFTLATPPMKRREYKRVRDQMFSLIMTNPTLCARRTDTTLCVKIPTYRGILANLTFFTLPRLELFINPSLLLGGNHADIYSFSEGTISQIEEITNETLSLLSVSTRFHELVLSRIDCTKDVTLDHSDDVVGLIRCIQRTELNHGYEHIRFDKSSANYRERNQHSFRARCRDVTLTIYDKTFQLNEQMLMPSEEVPQNRLRIEAAFGNGSFQRILNEHCQATIFNDLGHRIEYFSNLSIELIQRQFKTTITPGRYLRIDRAVEEIELSPFLVSTKQKMIDFIYLVSRCNRYGIAGAIVAMQKRGLTERQTNYLMGCFREINLNPATLPLKSPCAELPSVSELIGQVPPAQDHALAAYH